MEFLYYLEPKYDKAKSFYKKAVVLRDNNGTLYLKSYNTIVVTYTDRLATKEQILPTLKIYGWFSITTARHINEFLRQLGYNAMNKQELKEWGELEANAKKQ